MKIQVTRAHIDEGERSNCRHCPVARAIQELLREPLYVHVDQVEFIIYGPRTGPGPDLKHYGPLPRLAGQFVIDFDYSRRVYPFWFELEIPADLLKEAA